MRVERREGVKKEVEDHKGRTRTEGLRVFQHWGRVWDVFVAQRRDVGGHKYGFVRFLDVCDAFELERKLDNIYTGSQKMRINIPKYVKRVIQKRGQLISRQVEAKGVIRYKDTLRRIKGEKGEGMSRFPYAKITTMGKPHMRKEWRVIKRNGEANRNILKGQIINTTEADKIWIEESLVGWLEEPSMFDKLQNVVALENDKITATLADFVKVDDQIGNMDNIEYAKLLMNQHDQASNRKSRVRSQRDYHEWLRDLGDEKHGEELSKEDNGHSCRDEKESDEVKEGVRKRLVMGLKEDNESSVRSPNFSGIQGLQSRGFDEDNPPHNSGIVPKNGGSKTSMLKEGANGNEEGDPIVHLIHPLMHQCHRPTIYGGQISLPKSHSHNNASQRVQSVSLVKGEDSVVVYARISDEEEDVLSYGLTIASKGQEGLLKEFDVVLKSCSCFSVQRVSETAKKKEEALDGSVAKEVLPKDLESGKKEVMEGRQLLCNRRSSRGGGSTCAWRRRVHRTVDLPGRVGIVAARGGCCDRDFVE
ncbi:hypothetical protein VNO78_02964 [Psophocarpus tetragonolobus]|uniref:RRM domain-containing protein n=1 Tax=Psophocarpus tetragonolobus TaxID=3891 RepID=A0AAN9TD10_PSOTE